MVNETENLILSTIYQAQDKVQRDGSMWQKYEQAVEYMKALMHENVYAEVRKSFKAMLPLHWTCNMFRFGDSGAGERPEDYPEGGHVLHVYTTFVHDDKRGIEIGYSVLKKTVDGEAVFLIDADDGGKRHIEKDTYGNMRDALDAVIRRAVYMEKANRRG